MDQQEETNQLSELHGLGHQIRTWQENQEPKLSDNALRSRYPEIGSTRTYKRIYTNEGIKGIDVHEWLPRYQGVWSRIEGNSAEEATEPLYEDLSPASAARSAALQLMKQTGLQRLVVLEGDTGTGKTSALQVLRQRYGRGCHLIESHEGWARLRTALKCLADGLGIRAGEGPSRPQSSGDWLELIVDTLNKRGRRVILLDECQHWGGEMLNALKTLINRTNSVFVVAAMGTLWQKLTSAKYEEAKQLTLNRMLTRVKLAGPSNADAKKYFKKRAGISPTKGAIDQVLDLAETRGSFAFLRRTMGKISVNGETDHDAILLSAANDATIELGE